MPSVDLLELVHAPRGIALRRGRATVKRVGPPLYGCLPPRHRPLLSTYAEMVLLQPASLDPRRSIRRRSNSMIALRCLRPPHSFAPLPSVNLRVHLGTSAPPWPARCSPQLTVRTNGCRASSTIEVEEESAPPRWPFRSRPGRARETGRAKTRVFNIEWVEARRNDESAERPFETWQRARFWAFRATS